jgi:peptidoglycan/LPS O-acetylase OafA/YrhL
VSTTLSDTGPHQALVESMYATVTVAPRRSAPVRPSAPPSAPPTVPSGAKSRPHIIAFDMIRLIIMVFVVGVHTLAFAGGQVTVALGAVTTVFHTSRELFLLLTALVLTYNYGQRNSLNWVKFWRRRYWLVLPAYLTWSGIYYWADGSGRGPFPSAFGHDLLTANARYHLYFLLVSMQIYLLFPVFRWLLRKTEGYHLWLLAAAVIYQLALTTSLHYGVGRHGALSQWLNGAAQGYWVESYVLYVVAGAIAGWHFEAVCAFTRQHLARVSRIALVAGIGVVAGIGTFLIEIYGFGATPANASAVFQPIVVVEAVAFGWALLAGGLLWGDRGAPHRKFFAAGSASSFGIYLAHPLVLQGVLAVAGASYLGADGGLIGAIRRAPSVLEVLALLFVAVPIIYALAWVIASAARRTPASLMLTGREYAPRKRVPRGRHAATR